MENFDELQRIFSERLNYYLEKSGRTQLELAKYIGVTGTTVNNYCRGYNLPKMGRVDKICEFFQISRSDLMEEPREDGDGYYVDQETAEIANRVLINKDLRVLFDAAQDAKPEDIKIAADLLKRLKGTNIDG